MIENESLIIPVEQFQATRLVTICESLSQATLVNDVQRIRSDYQNLATTILESHKGSLFLPKILQRNYLPHIIQSPNPEFISSFPDLIGIYINKKEDDLAREKVKHTLGIDLPKKQNTLGILTPAGARQFELSELVTIMPSSIRAAISQGRIGEAEQEAEFHRQGRIDYLEYYGEPYDSEENLSIIITNPGARLDWRNRLKAQETKAEKARFLW